MSAATSLICFRGADFRKQAVLCPHCSWEGLAGNLNMPAAKTLGCGAGVSYACPSCETIIARHAGLSEAEIARELLSIRKILAQEFEQTLPVATESTLTDKPSYESVRKLIRGIA